MDVRAVPAVHLAEVAGDAAAMTNASIGPVVGALFERIARALHTAGVVPVGPPVAYYRPGDGTAIRVHAGFPVSTHVGATAEWSAADLPACEQVVIAVHHGPVTTIDGSWAALGRALASRTDLQASGDPREVYLDAPMADPSAWVVELQQPVERV